MKVLITGFDPFGGETVNPSYEAVKALPTEIAGAEILMLEVPTVFDQSIKVLKSNIKEIKPDLVLCIGQAGGRFDVTLERVAINIRDARIEDNEGNAPVDEPVVVGGDAAYFTNLPIKAMAAAIREKGIPASISNSAGTFVCNNLMYGLMNMIHVKKLPIRGGFMHVPYINEQVLQKKDMPFMKLNMITEAIIAAVEAAVLNEETIKTGESGMGCKRA